MAAGKLSLIAFELSAVRLTEGETTQCRVAPAAASTTTNIRILVVEEFGFSQLTNSDC